MTILRRTLALALVCFLAGCASTKHGNSAGDLIDTANPARSLGPVFSTYGVSFRPPLGSERVDSSSGDPLPGGEVAAFALKKKGWLLQVKQITLEEPMPLAGYRDPNTRQDESGLLDSRFTLFRSRYPYAELIELDAHALVRERYAARLVMSVSYGGRRFLIQDLIVRVSDQMYFTFTLTCPSDRHSRPHAATQPAQMESGPRDAAAAAAFDAMRDRISISDSELTAIRKDQEERLYQTRALLLDLTEQRLSSVLLPQQFFRVRRNGEEVGWSYAEEMTGRQRRALETAHAHDAVPLPHDSGVDEDGLVVYTQSCFTNERKQTVRSTSEMFVTFDRAMEQWGYIATLTPKDAAERISTETRIGNSSRARRMVFQLPGNSPYGFTDDSSDRKAPATRSAVVYTLDTTLVTDMGVAEPMHFRLPPWYLPQAIGAVLPRAILPRAPVNDGDASGAIGPPVLSEPKSYFFYFFVEPSGQVTARYVDLRPPEELRFNGRRFRGIVVTERVGLNGPSTIHYFDERGNYLGSRTPATGLEIIATTRKDLLRQYPDVVLPAAEYFHVK